MTAPRNVAASVRQRLLNRARTDQRPFDELLRYYAMERFLYRLSRSDHVERFVLKGALLLRVWDSPLQRPTMDIDLLGRTSNRAEEIEDLIRDVIGIHVDADGLDFDPASVRADRITADADYEGLRVRFEGRLGTA
ncbi:nucleotidyl transferase AbiEii/AbiGii toxin family protein, partial [bacterium]|nr:nucleotidyl transferase AbiEii/AbiGii toxin family protein [bacterium]